MSSVPQNNITVIQGEDSTLLELQWLDSDSVAVDLTGVNTLNVKNTAATLDPIPTAAARIG